MNRSHKSLGVVTGCRITDDGKLLVTLDGTKIPYEKLGLYDYYTVNSIMLSIAAERSYGDGQSVYLLSEYFSEPIDVVWTCATLGHEWGDTGYVWSEDNSTVTAFKVCQRPNHVGEDSRFDIETADAVLVSSEPASCTEDGEDVYKVTFENPDFNEDEPTEGNTIKTVTTEALGHDWDEGQPIEGKEGFLLYIRLER